MTSDRYRGIRNTITFPKPLYEKIKALADKEHRSISQQVIRLCELAIEEIEKKQND